MTAQSFQCPSCGAPVTPKGNAAVVSCPHCNTSVVVPEELREDRSQWTTIVFDNFTSNENKWPAGRETSEYFSSIDRTIGDGRYRWEVVTGRANSISPAWMTAYQVSDFHLTIHCKHISGSKLGSSWGALFRIQDNSNYYWFRITDSKHFAVSVVKGGQWKTLLDWTLMDAIKPNGLNRLEVIAQGSHFVFSINGQVVHELDDDHVTRGLVGVAVEGYTVGEKTVFDFIDIAVRIPRSES